MENFMIFKTLREIMSEPGASGTLSWGRVASSFAFAASLGWVTHLLLHGINPHDIPFKDLAEFSIAPYGANKVATAVQSFSSNPVNKQ